MRSNTCWRCSRRSRKLRGVRWSCTHAGGSDGYGVVKPPFDADDMLGAAVKAAIDEKQHGREG
jgi:hypothetical protein